MSVGTGQLTFLGPYENLSSNPHKEVEGKGPNSVKHLNLCITLITSAAPLKPMAYLMGLETHMYLNTWYQGLVPKLGTGRGF